ncbi:Ionotropic glutamate receptor [Corchorus capsularis]|uniref:Glutamate receptor n=1 Tax=Corchorus capsularis TaxID=210143 RepID=A0A1R3J375_COCAP|nr:Ionotropic glutamate receptor [Corchorus capsularis]
MHISFCCFLSLLGLGLFISISIIAATNEGIIIGGIVDNTTRIGKEERVAMEMALEDFNTNYKGNQSLILHVKNSSNKFPLQAALAAMDLINREGAEVILGLQTWEETSLVAEIGSQNHIPILSFSDLIPSWAKQNWPFLVATFPNQYAQAKAIASMVQSYEWHQVTVIYEDMDSSASKVISDLSHAFKQGGIETILVAIPPLDVVSLSKEIGRLKRDPCRVFVVHLSFPMALHLFEKAKMMNMMRKGYVWISTTSFSNLVHSINASTISSWMQGIIGVRSYLLTNDSKFHDFHIRFRKRFSLEHPEESNHEPGFYAVQAYNAVQIVAQAMRGKKMGGSILLEKILDGNFDGLTGKLHFINQGVAPANTFQIINMIGRSYRELGFWVDRLGFSETVDSHGNFSNSMKDLGQVFWPGGPINTPKGWDVSTNGKPLRFGVPARSIFNKYVKIQYDPDKNQTSITGLAIELFETVVEQLPFHLTYDLFPFNGTYDDLVKQIYLKNFDGVVGDVGIIANRYQYAEFTQPYTEPGLVMIVPLRSKTGNKTWLFLRPFTKAMWFLIGIINIYNGFVVWLIERNHCSELNGSALNQTGSLLWLSFSTFLSFHGERPRSNLSRMAMAVWLFVALVLTQIYTANLASILTVQGLEPTVTNIESLQSSNAKVGHTQASFVKSYLVNVLRFSPTNMKNYTSAADIANDLRNRVIAAVFFEVPAAKLFLAMYCKGFTMAGPTYKVGGYGFVFPKGSPLLPLVTEALLNVSESGKLRELEQSMLASQNCTQVDLEDDISSLSPSSFWALFLLTGSMSTVALLIYVSYGKPQQKSGPLLAEKVNWLTMWAVMLRSWSSNSRLVKLFSAKELSSNVGSPPIV